MAAVASQGLNDESILEGGQQTSKPTDIEQDIKEMERRKRVEMIMNSQMFREELERIIEGQFCTESNGPFTGLTAIHQVTELLQRGGFTSSTLKTGPSIIPINDIRGVDSLRFDKAEKSLRCKLAATYRLVDLMGWSQNIYNHISLRLNQEQEHFLINPFGLQYNEITASSLVKIDIQGNVIDRGSTNFNYNKPGFILHAAIHRARPDLKAVIHIHYPAVVAVSTFKHGLLPLSQEAAIVGDVSYFDYSGILTEDQEQEDIAKALGVHNKVLILRNHGVLVGGTTIEEAFYYLTNIVKACEVQVSLLPVGLDNLVLMSKEAMESTRETIRHSAVFGRQVNGQDRKIDIKDLDFEAYMRMLDNAGYRTGYVFKNPLIRTEERFKHDVEEPPTVTSVRSDYFDEDKWLSPLRKLVDGKKTHDRVAWVNSPNVYQKKEILETGTQDPRVITRWIRDDQLANGQQVSNGHSTKIDSSRQFAPQSLDAEEFKRKQKALKELRLKNTISSGPQSQILDGVTWDEMEQAAAVGDSAGHTHGQTGKSHEQTILVGAASKGIIQRDHQLDAKVYKSAYAKNPFDNVSDIELAEYRRLVERKQRGEELAYEEIPENMRHLLNEPIIAGRASSPQSPVSPLSDEEESSDPSRERSKSKDKKDKEKKRKSPFSLSLGGGRKDKDKSGDEEKLEKVEKQPKEEKRSDKKDERKKEKEKEKDKKKKREKA